MGSCVGMRGARVKNIVNELRGERIDIVRYSEDSHSYIAASLSPALISEIKLDKENKKATVIVNQDQLSLAIGKHGQNVRLASKLTGWNLDVRTKEEYAREMLTSASPQSEAREGPNEEKPKSRLYLWSSCRGWEKRPRDCLSRQGFLIRGLWLTRKRRPWPG